MIKVVNIIPKSLSGETQQDSEPNIAVNPENTNQIAITAFTPDPMGGANAPIFISSDGGNTWSLNKIVPSQDALTGTGDITPRFAGGGRFYAGILRRPQSLRLNILRTTNFAGASTMTVLSDRNNVDQPYVQAAMVPSGPDAGKDRVYVGLNDLALFGAANGKTATIDRSLDAAAASPTFNSIRIEKRTTAGQNGPQIRPAVHSDGTVYAVFYGWRSTSGSQVTADVVVVRDDNWGSGNNAFTALTDPSDNKAGRLVAKAVKFTFNGSLGQERLGGDLSIAVLPSNSSTLYIAFCDVQAGVYTLHVRRSIDRGVTWSSDLKTVSSAKNPALAINGSGLVGLAYQALTGSGANQRWDTHLVTTSDGFTTSQDLVLATVPAATPVSTFLPYMGDYIHMMTVGNSFYGVFSTNNTPDLANFPQSVTYLRNHDFVAKKLFAVNGTTQVAASIDPFFFQFTPQLIVFTKLSVLTKLTAITKFTKLTQLTGLTKFTFFTPFTNPLFTQFGPPDPGGPIEIGLTGGEPEGPAPMAQPFIRFGNTIFAPEELDLDRFEPLSGVVAELNAIGITRLHQLAVCDPYLLSLQLRYSLADASRLVALGQMLLRGLVQ